MENFRCNVKGCRYCDDWKNVTPNALTWLDINHHFVNHHPELHGEMGKHILQRTENGEWVAYVETDVNKMKKELDKKEQKKKVE